MTKILIINGSPRKKGNTDKIVSVLKKIVEKRSFKIKEFELF